jgi:hypothetical protein
MAVERQISSTRGSLQSDHAHFTSSQGRHLCVPEEQPNYGDQHRELETACEHLASGGRRDIETCFGVLALYSAEADRLALADYTISYPSRSRKRYWVTSNQHVPCGDTSVFTILAALVGELKLDINLEPRRQHNLYYTKSRE